MEEPRMSIEDARKEFIGKLYTRELARKIESLGYGFTVSCATGKIADIFEVEIPKCRFSRLIEKIIEIEKMNHTKKR